MELIAAEKAGIFKPGVPALVGDGCAAMEVLQVWGGAQKTGSLKGLLEITGYVRAEGRGDIGLPRNP